MKSAFDSVLHQSFVRRWTLNALRSTLYAIALTAIAASAGVFAGSDTYVVTNAATAVISATAPTSGGAAMPWHPAGILANFRDSPTGAVLVVSHVRSGIVNRLVNTNGTISVTNVLYTSVTGVTAAIVWDPAGRYTIADTNDSLRITTSSTNAEIILNKEIQR